MVLYYVCIPCVLTGERPEPLDMGEEELKAVGGSSLTIVAARVTLLEELGLHLESIYHNK